MFQQKCAENGETEYQSAIGFVPASVIVSNISYSFWPLLLISGCFAIYHRQKSVPAFGFMEIMLSVEPVNSVSSPRD